MGHTNWNDAAYNARQNVRKQTNTSAFAYDTHVRQTGKVSVHPQMNILGKIRESRDSAEHPQSVAIAVLLDVTGSMLEVPIVLQSKLGALMNLLIKKGYVTDPQILFGAIGDAYSDRVPLQIGQFESGLEMDDELGKIFLEGGGGGTSHESYELGLYTMAYHTSIDCYEKRQHKGYLFTIGDEKPYDIINKNHIANLLGDDLPENLTIQQVLADLLERYNYFHIIPTNTSYRGDPAIRQHWQDLLGERVLILDDEAAVSETIALTIGLCEGTLHNLDQGQADLVDAGYSPNNANHAVQALRPYAQNHKPSIIKRFFGKTLPPATRI